MLSSAGSGLRLQGTTAEPDVRESERFFPLVDRSALRRIERLQPTKSPGIAGSPAIFEPRRCRHRVLTGARPLAVRKRHESDLHAENASSGQALLSMVYRILFSV